MAYKEFTLPSVEQKLGIVIGRSTLFVNPEEVQPPLWLQEALAKGRPIAFVSEKSRSEYIVAPILLALRELTGNRISIYSGERMALFLVTCVYDEGIYESSFRVVEAPSRLAVAENMLNNPFHWKTFLDSSYLWDGVEEKRWNTEELLDRIDSTHVDGDSRCQLAIHEIKNIERIQPLYQGASQ
ncbi:MAG: hypothetical protein ACREEM_47155 [Blastocatellia bacterium]